MSSSRRPLPAVGEVIRYAYLWSHEQAQGHEDAMKERPTAVVALVRVAGRRDEVVVMPITSRQPDQPAAGVLIPAATRRRLGLQDEPCWVIVAEYNRFLWPGPDLRGLNRGEGSISYGILPDGFMAAIRDAFERWRASNPVREVRRTE